MRSIDSLRLVIPVLGLLVSGSPQAFQAPTDPGAPSPIPSDQTPASITAPDLAAMRRDAEAIIAELADNKDGEVYSGAVEGTVPDDFAIAVALVDGRTLNAGRAETRFPLMSISKPFTFALAVEQRGIGFLVDKVGVSATGMPYNDVAAGAVRDTTEQNPLVNAGAIATHSFVQGDGPEEKIGAVVALYSALADRPLAINEAWRAQPRALTYTLAYQMKAAGRLEGDVDDVTDRYLEACIVGVTVEDLARMGATLANDGVKPGSDTRVLSHETVRAVLSVMVIAGMYEHSGLWWTRVGLPAKSGVSGAILAVVPGWGAIVAYSPRLDAAGNSVRGALAIERLVDQWRLHSIDRLLRD
ncbi:glutaminase A [Thiorhodococcus minor]|uniref:glutaminase n=1 Tax=Thiorhodococcus minor TaxID=57489 RepID=A0A6M0K6A6_9GAMM|nr:glutaminase A [Thiorhodococcus minor]NEV64979.1 glutaminase A [Thiorhodococcus minor]